MADVGAEKTRRRNWKGLLRLVHSYLTMFSLLLFLFFGVTGFILNHEDWFGLDQSIDKEDSGELDIKLCKEPDKLAIVELLRRDYHVRGPLYEFQVDELELVVLFRRPGHSADVVIDRETGAIDIKTEISGTLAMLTEIHQGKSGGLAGALIVDATSILLILAGLSGFLIWLTVPAQRKAGLALLMAGSLSFIGLLLILFGAFG
jgi:uncharacterized protein